MKTPPKPEQLVTGPALEMMFATHGVNAVKPGDWVRCAAGGLKGELLVVVDEENTMFIPAKLFGDTPLRSSVWFLPKIEEIDGWFPGTVY